MRPSRYDVVIAGGGHNGLTAAAYLARAGRSVLVLERQDQVGGVAVSARAFDGVDARLSRYSYLVSLLPDTIVADLGLRVELRPRRIASYTPAGAGGLLIDDGDTARTAASFAALTGDGRDWDSWQRFYAAMGNLARRIFPTMTEPLRSRAELRALAGDDATWVYRRDESLRLPRAQTFVLTDDGIPYLRPELVFLFKAKAMRPKDELDFVTALPRLDLPWLHRLLDPNHPWLRT